MTMSIAQVGFIASLALASASEAATQAAMQAKAMSTTNMWAKYQIPMKFIDEVVKQEHKKAEEKYNLALQKVDFMEIDKNSTEFQDADRVYKVSLLLQDELVKMVSNARKQVSEQLQKSGLNTTLMEDAIQAQEKAFTEHKKKHGKEHGPESLLQFMEEGETNADAQVSPASNLEMDSSVETSSATEETAAPYKAIQKVYYINNADKERQDFMQKQMTEMSHQLSKVAKDIPHERFKATRASEVQGKHETVFSNGKVASYLTSFNDKAKHATVANYLSHAKVLQKINEEIYDNRPILVLEDDAKLHDDWMQQAEQALQKVPEDWDLLKIGYWGGRKEGDRLNEKIYRACCYSDAGDHYQGMQAYLVRPSSVSAIMKSLKKRPVADFDKVTLMAPEGEQQDIHTYAIDKSLADHADIGKASRVLNAREKKMAKVIDNIEKMALAK